MADLDIAIAGRSYRVACADGEEDNLTRAAALLADEAEILREQFGGRFASLPESRVLLMASLMLGDRFRAMLDAAAMEPAPDEDLAPGAPGDRQPGFFDDSALTARVAELEAELVEAREAEAVAVSALEDAALRVRTLAAEIQEDVDLDEEDDDEDDDLDAAEDEAHGEGDDLEDEEAEADDDLEVSLTLESDADEDDEGDDAPLDELDEGDDEGEAEDDDPDLDPDLHPGAEPADRRP